MIFGDTGVRQLDIDFEEPEEYLWFRAHCLDNGMGGVLFSYQVEGLDIPGSDWFDEDVSGWTEAEILKLARDYLDAPRELVQIVWEAGNECSYLRPLQR